VILANRSDEQPEQDGQRNRGGNFDNEARCGGQRLTLTSLYWYKPHKVISLAARPKTPTIPKQIIVELSENLGVDIAAFAKAYYDAPYTAIARQALNEHIEQTLNREPDRKAAFLAAKAALTKKPAESIRLLEKPKSKLSS
jgi:hypothetical protein